jgi:hypothetical protein
VEIASLPRYTRFEGASDLQTSLNRSARFEGSLQDAFEFLSALQDFSESNPTFFADTDPYTFDVQGDGSGRSVRRQTSYAAQIYARAVETLTASLLNGGDDQLHESHEYADRDGWDEMQRVWQSDSGYELRLRGVGFDRAVELEHSTGVNGGIAFIGVATPLHHELVARPDILNELLEGDA